MYAALCLQGVLGPAIMGGLPVLSSPAIASGNLWLSDLFQNLASAPSA